MTLNVGHWTLDISASEFQLEFVPTHMASWQNFLVADRMAGPVFPKLKLSLELRKPAPAELEKLSKDRLEELKIHAWIYQKSPSLYKRFCSVSAIAPMGIPGRQAALLAGINPQELEAGVEGSAGEGLLKNVKSIGADGPKMRVSGAEVAMQFNLPALAQAINEKIPEAERLASLSAIGPAAPKAPVEILMVHGKSFAEWAVVEPGALENLKRLPFELKIKEVDASSDEGRAILKEADFSLVPAVFFRALDDSARPALDDFAERGALEKRGAHKDLYLAKSLTSSGVLWQKRESEQKNLDLYIMSQCPYGVAAQRALLEAQKDGKMPSGVKVNYRYIVNKDKDGEGQEVFRSLHGQGELEENLRQLVIQKYEPQKLTCYLEKRLPSIDSSLWNETLEACGVDVAKFIQLYKEKSAALMEEDYRLTEDLDVRSSPTFVWRGRYSLIGLGSLKNLDDFKNVDFKVPASGSSAGKCQTN
ncbi:MAG: hypothetical protein HY547_03265 [Elusimicrobia bacterium]|nr:hypothetical protein [Elusimicrobiota bacterium]